MKYENFDGPVEELVLMKIREIIMAPLSRQKSEIFLMNRKYQNVE